MMIRGVLFLCLFSWSIAAAVQIPKPVVVTDTVVLRWLLAEEAPSGDLPVGIWSVSPVSDSDSRLIVYRDGTEFKRLPIEYTAQLLQNDPKMFSESISPRTEDHRPSLQLPSPYWGWVHTEPWDRLDGAWFQQTEGIDIGRSAIGSRGQRWWIQDQTWIRFAKIFGSTRLSLGLIRSTDYMNIQRDIRAYYGSNEFSDYSWQIGFTWKAFTYQLQSWSWVLPEYYWFEPSVDTLWAASQRGESSQSKGKVVRQFSQASDSSLGSGFSNNMLHQFEARLWHFRYRVLFDGDMYTEAVHRLGFEDLHTSIGTWGSFVVTCGGIWVPGFWFEAGPALRVGLPFLETWNEVSWMPLRFELMYENTSHFRLHFGTRIHWGGSNG